MRMREPGMLRLADEKSGCSEDEKRRWILVASQLSGQLWRRRQLQQNRQNRRQRRQKPQQSALVCVYALHAGLALSAPPFSRLLCAKVLARTVGIYRLPSFFLFFYLYKLCTLGLRLQEGRVRPSRLFSLALILSFFLVQVRFDRLGSSISSLLAVAQK